MRKLTRKQILARLFVGFFTLGSLLCTVNSAVAGGTGHFGEYKIEHSGSGTTVASITSSIQPGEKSDNTVTVNVYGPDSGTIPEIFGGSPNGDGEHSNNTLTITTTKEGITLSNVYGGYVVTGTGSATENKVAIASSTINGGVWGGYVYSGSATENKVAIASSTVDGSVFGGYVRSGSATENKVAIASSTAADVHGGCVEVSGNATQNIVDIASSTTGAVYGGRVDGTGSATQNIVNIASSTTGAVYGGNAGTGNATLNKVDIIASSTVNGAVYGGYVKGTGSATENKVAIASSTVNGAVYGGYAKGTGSATENATLNKVEISGGSEVKGSVYGGRSSSGNADSNEVKITNSSVAGTVNGGYVYNTGSANSNTVTIKDSIASDNTIYGGYTKNGNATENTVEISGSTIGVSDGHVYGGKVGTDDEGNGDAVSNTIIINNSIASASTIYGGYAYNGDANSNTVEITNSKTATVWGGYIKSESATGNTNSNTLKLTNCEINAGNIVAAENNGTGDGVENTVEVSGGIINIGLISGAQLLSGDAILNKVTISDLDSPATYTYIIGGTVTNGNAYSNAVTLDNIEKLDVYWVAGGQTKSGEAASNTVTIKNSNIKGLLPDRPDNYVVLGGGVTTGDAKQNEVTISGSTVNGNVYGGFTTSGYADENIIKINDGSTVTGDVSSGYVYGDGYATGNTFEISGGSTVNGMVFGGYVNNDGNVTDNTVVISGDSKLTGGVIGGESNLSGDAKGNTVEISDGASVSGGIYGGDSTSGDATENTVKINGGKTQDCNIYGAFAYGGNATDNTVEICGGSSVESNVYGGYVYGDGDGDATGNTVEISDGSTVTYDVYGGYIEGDGDATGNTVEISDGSTVTYDVYGGYVLGNGNATDNTVEISGGSTVNSSVYGGNVGGNGNATNNTVEISGGSTVSGDVYGGNVDETGNAVTGNKLIISGADNTIGGEIVNFETMTFDAADVKKDETMLSLTTESCFTFDVESIETNNANLAVGEKITLISSEVDKIYDVKTFKIDGKQADSISNKFIANVAKEDSDNIVHVNEYAYELSDYKLNLCNNSGFITGLYIDAEGAKQTLGKAEMTLSSVPEKTTKIYGAYSENADVTAGGATINLETTELSDVNLIGSYNKANETKIDTSKNTLNVNVSGVKVKSVNGFDNLNFKLVLDEKAMLDISDSYDMNGISFNSILPEDGFVGTQTILKAGSLANDNGAKFKINDAELNSTRTLTITTKNTDSVVYGTYTYGISSEIITLTGKSIVSAVNINSGETKAADNNTLKVTGKMAEKYTELYGAFNADGGAATDAVVDLSEAVSNENLTIYGGYSTGSGADVTTGNVLNVSKNGNKVKNILNFSTLDFTLGSDIAAGTTMLSTVDKVALGGASVNTEMSGIALAKGEKIVLLDNADKGNAELKLNGSTGDQTVAEENSSFVAVSSVGYNTNDNKIAIECKDAFAAGCYIDEKGKLGKDTLTLGSSAASNMRAGYERASEGAPDMSKYSDIYGVYSAGSANPTGATIEIVSAIDYSNSVLHGGYKAAERAFYADGNTLRVKSLNSKVKGVTDFETMEFDLPAETKSGDTMLKVTDEVDMAPTKSVGVEASKATGLKAGDSVNLIDSDAGIKNFGTQKVTVSGLTDKTGEVKVDDKALVLALDKNGEKPNKNTKAPVEAVSATMALVNQASALASSKLNKSMIAAVASANGGSATFASMNGGHSKYETGSYVEADSWNIGFGLAKKGMSSKNPDSTYGLFFQYGKSSFDTHNDGGFRGDGDSKMFGAGLTFHHEARSKYYYHGNVFVGKVDAKWNCKDGGYDDKATYYGMTFGMGRKHNASGNKTMDIYGRYAFNHVGSMNGDLNGLEYDFDSTSSHNLRLGLRMEYSQKNAAKAYWGLAWEHEFAGDSKATVATLGRTESPTLKGDSGIAEVGYQWKRGNWDYSINAEGSFGKREGVTGSFNINYNF